MATLRNGTYGDYYGSVIGESEHLSQTEMETNAIYINKFLTAKGWSKNAICAMLGNMQAESSINPGRWQSDSVGSTSLGYGLVQWTPSTKYIDWCTDKGITDYSAMDSNLQRIVYEVENNLQWIATSAYPLTFAEFTKSTESISNLAKAFLLNYERPADQSESVQTKRSSMAESWGTYLGGVPDTPVNPSKRKKRKYNFLLFQARQRRNLWTRTNF